MGEARLRRRDPDQAVEVERKGRSGRRPVRRALKRGRRGQRQPHQHQQEEAGPMVVEVVEVKALEVSGREKDAAEELLLVGRLLEARK